ncbi:FecR/PupR family sigma factor regulator, partial [Burkholderia ubonensis]
MAASGTPAIAPQVAQRAVEWWVDLQAGNTDDAFATDLARWRAADASHDAAWRHIEAVQGRLNRLAGGLD